MAINGAKVEKPIMARTQEKRHRDKAEQSEQADGKADKMSDRGEPVRWITVKGAHVPVYEDGSIGIGKLDSQEQLEKDYNSIDTMWDMTPTEKFSLAEKYTKEVANKDNFYENSVGFWDLAKAPKRDPDHTSVYFQSGTGAVKVSSKYWYTDEGVYRQSDHWGSDVASSSWYIKGRSYKNDGVQKGKRETAFISWKDLKAKGLITKDRKTEEYSLSGFEFKK